MANAYFHKSAPVLIPIAIGVVVFYLNSNLLGLLFSLDEKYVDLAYGRGSWWLKESLFIRIMYVGVVVPFVEELLFHRLMLNHFLKKNKALTGLAISSVCFGLWHMVFGWGILKALDMSVVGLIFGLVYCKWSFQGSLLAHYGNNAVAVAAMANI